jgi:hypothetical protein
MSDVSDDSRVTLSDAPGLTPPRCARGEGAAATGHATFSPHPGLVSYVGSAAALGISPRISRARRLPTEVSRD